MSLVAKLEKLAHASMGLPQAILIWGDGKPMDIVRNFALKQNDQQAYDVLSLSGDGCKVEYLRSEVLDHWFTPTRPTTKRFLLIDEFEKLNANCVNLLLKTLEEPAANKHIILITGNILNIIATIKSRCIVVYDNAKAKLADDFSEAMQQAKQQLQQDLSNGVLPAQTTIETLGFEHCREVMEQWLHQQQRADLYWQLLPFWHESQMLHAPLSSVMLYSAHVINRN